MTSKTNNNNRPENTYTRRDFIKTTAAVGASSFLAGMSISCDSQSKAASSLSALKRTKPNFLFVICDQLCMDALSGYGCNDVHTPNLDRLISRGVSFMESHSTSPVCSPARSSMFTGVMPQENGVVSNNRPINSNVPTMGNWFGQAGYQTFYCGKWHLPDTYTCDIDGFTVLPSGQVQGDIADVVVSRNCQAFLEKYNEPAPFVLVSSFMQPHDICYWYLLDHVTVPKETPFAYLKDKLPGLPANHKAWPKAPKNLNKLKWTAFNESQWRYYRYSYYRQVEMLDADIGRVLDALEQSKHADNTVVIFTSDHGDGMGRHSLVTKWHPYDESMKVPLVISWPGIGAMQNVRNNTNLVNGLDILPTMCDLAGIPAPASTWGRSLKPLLMGQSGDWREFISADTNFGGKILRTPQYKYVKYPNDPVEQLFDMLNDPWETKNLYEEAGYSDIVKSHRQLLNDWQNRLKIVKPSPILLPNA